jgi:YidC/Oxa1 family membrane protein insertase
VLEKLSTQQRLLLATTISILFFIGYSILFPPQQQVRMESNSTAQKDEVTSPKSEISAPTVSTSSTAIGSQNFQANREDTLVEVQFSHAILTIDNLGRFSSKTLLADKYRDDNGVQAQIITKFSPKPLEIRFADNKLNEEAFKTPYITNSSKVDLTTGSKTLVLTQTLSSTVVTKKLTIYPAGNYDLEISLSEGKRFFVSNGLRPKASNYGFVVEGAMVKVGDETTIFEDGDAIGTSLFRDVKLTSSFDRYYASIFYNIDYSTNVIVEGDREKNPMIFLEGLDKLVFSGYIGPKDYELLKTLNPELTSAIEYGLITMIAKPIFFVLNELHAIFGNWGWAIVVLTILIRLVLYPLTYRGMISMQKLKDVAPEMKEIQRKYKGNPQQMQVKMMELYKKHGANPMGGCLPLILQIPIFFAIYRVLLNAVELQGEGWIFWIEDLAKMDPYFILPILMGGTMFWQQHITPNNFTDPLQEKIFKFLPLIFTFFFITFPAGLTLYWLINNMLSIAQQYIVNAKFQKIKEKKAELEKSKK